MSQIPDSARLALRYSNAFGERVTYLLDGSIVDAETWAFAAMDVIQHLVSYAHQPHPKAGLVSTGGALSDVLGADIVPQAPAQIDGSGA